MQFIQNIDDSILYFIQDHMVNPFLNILMPIITTLGNGGILWIIISIVLILNKKYRKYGLAMALSLVLCFLVGNVFMKNAFMRSRPCWIDSSVHLLIPKPTDFSFPSGHSMCSFAGATVLYFMNKKIGIGAIILAFLIAFSRLYLFVHYPSDVLIGSIIGIILGIVSTRITIKFYKKKFNL